MTREQLLALLRDAVNYLEHYEWCEHRSNWFEGVVCDCGHRELMVRVEDALATERTSGAADDSLPSPEAPPFSGGMHGSREHHPRRFFTGG